MPSFASSGERGGSQAAPANNYFFFDKFVLRKNCSRLRFLLWVIDELMNIKITLNEISLGGLLLTLSHEIYSRMGVLNTECDFFGFETKTSFSG